MALQTTTNINVDFYDKKYIVINAKQLDRSSRFLSVTCYNHGELYPINAEEHAAYIRYKKADGHGVFAFCEINSNGQIAVELTEQMLAYNGYCYADLVIVNKGSASIDANTGKITIQNSGILSTMTFCIDVSEAAVENSEMEVNGDFMKFNDALEGYWADFEDIVLKSKSWAVGETGVRDGEDTNNAKYYSQLSETSQENASVSEENALSYAKLSQSYAIGGSGVRTNEDNDNALYYYELIKSVINGFNSGFIPMGTISFAELATAEKVTGFTYNISDDFITNDTFAEGEGKFYTAGTNVYCRLDGKWDCMGGSASPTATIDEIKEYLEII